MVFTLSYGMVGGGEGAFIGDVHRKAAAFDRLTEITAGCFSRDAAKSATTGQKLGISSDRIYTNYEEMAEKESKREDGIHFVSIVTPNSSHYDIAKTFLLHGIHVVCDKPLTVEESEARELERISKERGLLFCVTYTYSGYPMVKQAREMVRQGKLGDIYMVMAEYPQEWILHADASAWRMDPAVGGKSCCVGDIGVHIAHTVSYVTGLKIASLCANLNTYGREMKLDNNASIMVKYTNGASGVYWCSQVATGYNNGLKIRIFGTGGSLEWEQETPDVLRYAPLGQPVQMLSRGRDPLYPAAAKFSRIPGGHPEGVYEAFANIYKAFSLELIGKLNGTGGEETADYPRIEEGIEGVRFVDKCLESAQNGSQWVVFDTAK